MKRRSHQFCGLHTLKWQGWNATDTCTCNALRQWLAATAADSDFLATPYVQGGCSYFVLLALMYMQLVCGRLLSRHHATTQLALQNL